MSLTQNQKKREKMQLREAIKSQGYGANRAIAKRLGYSEQHLHGVANGDRVPSRYMLACLLKHFGNDVRFDNVLQPVRKTLF